MNMQMYQALTLLWSALLQLMGRRAQKAAPSHMPPGGETRPSSEYSSHNKHTSYKYMTQTHRELFSNRSDKHVE